jgi:hypothetical protein
MFSAKEKDINPTVNDGQSTALLSCEAYLKHSPWT